MTDLEQRAEPRPWHGAAADPQRPHHRRADQQSRLRPPGPPGRGRRRQAAHRHAHRLSGRRGPVAVRDHPRQRVRGPGQSGRLRRTAAPAARDARTCRSPRSRTPTSITPCGGDDSLAARHARTRELIGRAAAAGADAGTLFDHPLLRVDVGDRAAYLEPDLVAFQVAGRFHVVEIKSFAIIDGQADGGKVAAAVTQAAVYVLALRQLLADLGYGPERVADDVVLVCPENFSNRPTAVLVDVRKQLTVLRRQLARLARIETLVAATPPDLSFDLALDDAGVPQRPVAEIVAGLAAIPSRYAPECLDACELAYVCRDESRDDTAALGRSVRDDLGGIDSVTVALDLANGARDARRRPESRPPTCCAPPPGCAARPGRVRHEHADPLARAEAVRAGIAAADHHRAAHAHPRTAAGLRAADPRRRGQRAARGDGRRRSGQAAAARRAAAAQPGPALRVRRRTRGHRPDLHRQLRHRSRGGRGGRGKEIRVRYADAPQVIVPNRGGIGFAQLFGRSTRFRRTDGDYAVAPVVPELGRWLTFLADRAEHPGSSLLLAATDVLAAHWATGQSAVEDQNLAALLGWIDPPAGRTGCRSRASGRRSAGLAAGRSGDRSDVRQRGAGAADPGGGRAGARTGARRAARSHVDPGLAGGRPAQRPAGRRIGGVSLGRGQGRVHHISHLCS